MVLSTFENSRDPCHLPPLGRKLEALQAFGQKDIMDNGNEFAFGIEKCARLSFLTWN